MARAARLSPRRRKQIARQGWQGLVTKRFGGDERAARLWFGSIGAWAYDQLVLDIYGAIRPVYPHPGSPESFRERLYMPSLFDPMLREPNFYLDLTA